MDPYDTAATRAVWTRVLQTTRLPEMPQVPAEAELLSMIEGEQKASAAYLSLARRGGNYAPLLRSMAAQEASHARRLQVLYYLLTGQKPKPRAAAVRTPGKLRDALHDCYMAELSSVRTYCAAAQQRKEHAELFYALAREERQHSKNLQNMAARLV